LSTVTAAKPKIADYPFTTLHPALGVARIHGHEFVLADIPGLIEGAHEGVGIGDRFLGHIERTHVVLHLVSAREEDVGQAYQTVRRELALYGHGLEEKPEIVALSQIDVLDEATREAKMKQLEHAAQDKQIIALSSATHDGLLEALTQLWHEIEAARKED